MIRRPVSGVWTWCPAPLWVIARRKSPRASGMVIRAVTEIAPADCPKTVTLSGSPPNAAMFSRTQRRAAIWSSSPRLAVPSGNSRKPSAPSR
ncbi:hypothetical protein RKD26_000199 [Streptomyces calvus]